MAHYPQVNFDHWHSMREKKNLSLYPDVLLCFLLHLRQFSHECKVFPLILNILSLESVLLAYVYIIIFSFYFHTVGNCIQSNLFFFVKMIKVTIAFPFQPIST